MGPLDTLLARRARSRKYRPHMGSQLGRQSLRRSVLGSSRLAQRKFQRLDLEQVFEFPIFNNDQFKDVMIHLL